MAAGMRQAGSTRGRLAALGASGCLLAGAFGLWAGGDDAGASRAKEIGKTRDWPKASCPTPNGDDYPARRGCQVMGEVTGFQISAEGKENLMRIPADGHLVGWSVDLARPSKDERQFFERVLGDRAFNGAPSARLSVISKADGRQYRLRAQSPVARLNPLLGRRQYFTLNNPIEVQQGWTAALTSQTWVPAFAHDLRNDDLWRASRESDRCEGTQNLTERSRPHLNPGSVKTYGCTYRDARLIYWAYFQRAE
jgi:hypothetical protein